MNTRTEFQVIVGADGRPAFVVVPYDQFRRMKGGFTHGTVPNEVVNLAYERGMSPMAAWREHFGLTQAEVASRIRTTQAAYAQMERVKKPREATLEMVAAARELGCRVAVNGSDSTDHPQLYLDAGADAVLPGEADVSFPALADAWRTSLEARLDSVQGLILPDGFGGVVATAPARGISNVDTQPFPAWDLVDVEAYRRAWMTAHGRFSWNMRKPSNPFTAM